MLLIAAVAETVLPVFALIAIGYLVARWRLLPEVAEPGMTAFVFRLAIPVMIFRSIATAELPETPVWGYWLAYFLGVAGAWALSMGFALSAGGASRPVATIAGLAAGYGNTVLIGIPLVLVAFGDEAAVPLILLITIHLPIMTLATAILCGPEDEADKRTFIKALEGTLRTVLRHPIILGLAAGAVWNIAGLTIPPLAAPVIEGIADAAIPCALITMGLTLNRYGAGGGPAVLGIAILGKLIIHPALVFVLARYVFDLDPLFVNVAVLLAAALAVVTVSAWLALLLVL